MDMDVKSQTVALGQAGQTSTRREWLSVFAVALGAFSLVTTEFLPVGLLPEVARTLDVSLGSAGLMITAPGMIATVAAPVILIGTKAIDRRLVMLALSGLLFLSNVVSATAPNFLVLLAARALLGICLGGFWTVALATSGSLVQSQQSARAMSIVFSAVTAATVIGVPLGTYFGSISTWQASFVATAALVAIAFVGQLIFLPSIIPQSRQSWSAIASALLARGTQMGLAATALIIAAHLAAYTYIAPYLIDFVGLPPLAVPWILLVFGAIGFAANLSAPAFLGRYPLGVFATLVVLFSACFLVLPFTSSSLEITVLVLVVWAICNGAVLLSMNSWVIRRSAEHAEAASALFVSTVQIGIAFGAIAGGAVVDTLGVPANFGLAFLLAALTAIPLVAERNKFK
ncbi:MFS transporter [Rhizobium leguminosarum]|uniref:MFS transporter n=1 Tax=Rhizobium leguminosarum TaxID=384 RepID=UPI00143F94D5|nr:MFS transporter [Rhizobium leguminosarum]NKL23916.1 MFS transporter [Rhizobium leguminosarum bv. viciae]